MQICSNNFHSPDDDYLCSDWQSSPQRGSAQAWQEEEMVVGEEAQQAEHSIPPLDPIYRLMLKESVSSNWPLTAAASAVQCCSRNFHNSSVATPLPPPAPPPFFCQPIKGKQSCFSFVKREIFLAANWNAPWCSTSKAYWQRQASVIALSPSAPY